MFDEVKKQLNIKLDEDTKVSIVRYLGNRYKSDIILFEYHELERLTKVALDDPQDAFSYIKPADGIDLSDLDSKSFRLINRISDYMIHN